MFLESCLLKRNSKYEKITLIATDDSPTHWLLVNRDTRAYLDSAVEFQAISSELLKGIISPILWRSECKPLIVMFATLGLMYTAECRELAVSAFLPDTLNSQSSTPSIPCDVEFYGYQNWNCVLNVFYVAIQGIICWHTTLNPGMFDYLWVCKFLSTSSLLAQTFCRLSVD